MLDMSGFVAFYKGEMRWGGIEGIGDWEWEKVYMDFLVRVGE